MIRTCEGKGVGITSAEKLCDLCKHRHPGSHPPACAAYPDRIPLAIRLMQVDHRQPYPGDHGIRFEPTDGSPETQAKVANLIAHMQAPNGAEQLQSRVAAVLKYIPFAGPRERQLFGLAVQRAGAFEDLPEEIRNLILRGEQAREVARLLAYHKLIVERYRGLVA
jgi:hypothetical protein